MVREPVQQGTGQPFAAQDLGPFVEGQVAGHQGGAALVALAEHLEQQLRPALRERHEAELVDDQQPVAGQLLLQAQQALLVARLQEFVHQGGRRGEPDRHPPLAGRQAARPRPRAMWVLPVPLLPSAITFSRRSMYSPRASSRTSALLSEGMARKSKPSRLLTVGKWAARIRRSTTRPSRSISSSSARRSR